LDEDQYAGETMTPKKETKETQKNEAHHTHPSKMSKEEQIGYHKGSLAVLAKERQEMGRILGIVEQLMQMHLAALNEMGVDLATEAEKLMGEAAPAKDHKSPGKPKHKPPIEDIL